MLSISRGYTDAYTLDVVEFGPWTSTRTRAAPGTRSARARTARQRYRMVVARARPPRSRRHPGVSRVDGTVHRRGRTAESSSSTFSGRFIVRPRAAQDVGKTEKSSRPGRNTCLRCAPGMPVRTTTTAATDSSPTGRNNEIERARRIPSGGRPDDGGDEGKKASVTSARRLLNFILKILKI